ncbi:methyltransferase domain-containing protein [Candidatus Peregrinibacteria bacterium]|nr:methyltransferase domain-containing protein [Candidatus Peregrinibacteria bacterium]
MDDGFEKIVIVGFGWVGQANALALARMGYEVFYYDVLTPHQHYAAQYFELYERLCPLKTPLEKDSSSTWYIVCIGDRVSEEGIQDISLIERALGMLSEARGKVILRSTVLPPHLSNLHFHYYFPEFLHEIKAVEECLNPYYYVLGAKEEQQLPSFLKEWETRAHKVFKGTPEEASHIKYLSNIWNALRVGFINEFGDSIALPITATRRQEIERVLDFILERKSYLRYGQGFGGHCLPKDLRAYTALKHKDGSVPLLQALLASNARHEEIVKQYQTLPQWFSFWDYQGGRLMSGATLALWWNKLNTNKVIQRLRHNLQPMRRAAERVLPSKTLLDIKKKWDNLATKNAYYYANPDTKNGRQVDEFEVRQTGKEDVENYILSDSFLLGLLGDLKAKIVLEIGSGVGRMTEYLAKSFGTVYGVDISPVMIEVAKRRLLHLSNIVLFENAGKELPIADNQIDLIFSYLVFRHLPNRAVIEAYVRETARVLKIGGVVKVQLRTGPETYRWRWFHGISFSAEKARQLFEQAGLIVLKIDKENSKSLWIIAKKS